MFLLVVTVSCMADTPVEPLTFIVDLPSQPAGLGPKEKAFVLDSSSKAVVSNSNECSIVYLKTSVGDLGRCWQFHVLKVQRLVDPSATLLERVLLAKPKRALEKLQRKGLRKRTVRTRFLGTSVPTSQASVNRRAQHRLLCG
jgi:hypothetical protein